MIVIYIHSPNYRINLAIGIQPTLVLCEYCGQAPTRGPVGVVAQKAPLAAGWWVGIPMTGVTVDGYAIPLMESLVIKMTDVITNHWLIVVNVEPLLAIQILTDVISHCLIVVSHGWNH